MKTLVILTVLLGCSAAADLSAALENPAALLSLYNQYSTREGKLKSPQRLSLFRDTLRNIAAGNAEHPSWKLGLNKFADMTKEEKQSYLGLNATRMIRPRAPESIVSLSNVPESKDWRTEGKVTGVKDQASCGSCWTFGAVGPIETNYAILTGKRKSFAEKEYLDCVYKYDGCNGGWYEDCFDYSKKKGRLALTSDAPYKPSDGRCKKYKRKHNGLIAAKVTGYKSVPIGEDNAIQWLSQGAVAVAFEVTDAFFSYQSGIIKDTTCRAGNTGSSAANHAVTGVGYTKNSMIIKNSWGASWGMKGYFEVPRGTDMCEYFRWIVVPTMETTGDEDNDPDYVPTEDEDCKGTNADGCACGTVRCGDGQCRHAHMC